MFETREALSEKTKTEYLQIAAIPKKDNVTR